MKWAKAGRCFNHRAEYVRESTYMRQMALISIWRRSAALFLRKSGAADL
ncbi:hypothetical protein PO124_00015 [Bacillus licheniformis]|nr:hypothetical protein [Bacillus licheniformis]